MRDDIPRHLNQDLRENQPSLQLTRPTMSRRIVHAVVALAPALLVAAMLNMGGCGGSSNSNSPQAGANPALMSGSVFVPVAPPLSPNTVGYSPSQAGGMTSSVQARLSVAASTIVQANLSAAAATSVAKASLSAAVAPVVLDHFFYLVNGSGLPTPAPNNVAAPAPSATAFVLTVNGLAPNGAPNPNGGTGVGLALLNPAANGTQLWKAVQASTPGYFYLRSAESFNTNSATLASPNFLVGIGYNINSAGGSTVPLDLGYLSSWNTSIYLNQELELTSSGPTDGSSFQQWSYDTSNAQLTNLKANGQLYYASPQAGVASQTPAPGNQWYTYPNYFLEQVVNEPNSSPPFPAPSVATNSNGTTDVAGEQAAYDYISNAVLCGNGTVTCAASTQSCQMEGNIYAGIRCQYINLNAAPCEQRRTDRYH